MEEESSFSHDQLEFMDSWLSVVELLPFSSLSTSVLSFHIVSTSENINGGVQSSATILLKTSWGFATSEFAGASKRRDINQERALRYLVYGTWQES